MPNRWTAVARGAVIKALSEIRNDNSAMVECRKAWYNLGVRAGKRFVSGYHDEEHKYAATFSNKLASLVNFS